MHYTHVDVTKRCGDFILPTDDRPIENTKKAKWRVSRITLGILEFQMCRENLNRQLGMCILMSRCIEYSNIRIVIRN